MPVKLTISLVTYNGANYLPFCLESLFNQSYKDWRLYIIDNGSRDSTQEVFKNLTSRRDNVSILPAKQNNTGFARAHNEIIKQTDSKYILLLNQDIILEKSYLQNVIDFLDIKQKAGAVIGKLLRWQLVDSEAQKTKIIDSAGLGLNKNFQAVEIAAGQKDSEKYSRNEEVFGASGALPCYRRAALKDSGYFDAKFFSYKEDVDLAFRLRHAGWKAYCLGNAISYHERGLRAGFGKSNFSIMKNRRQKSGFGNYLSYRNHIFVLIKNMALLDLLKYGIFICWYELKKLVYLAVFEQKTLYAWAEIVKFLPRLLKQRRKIKPRSVSEWIK